MNDARVFPRFAQVCAKDTLADTPILVVQGARQVGKSTLVNMLYSSAPADARFISLDDPMARNAARLDPVGFVRQFPSGTLVIDEAQRVPELVLPLKAEVDRLRRPGRFVLTGSADLLQVKGVGDSLAGRAETVELMPFSQGELAEHEQPDDFITNLLNGRVATSFSPLSLEAVMLGGFPEPVRRAPRRRAAWFNNYVQRLVDHDATELHGGGYADHLSGLLRIIAGEGVGELVNARLARELNLSQTTVETYLRLARVMRLVVDLPSWGKDRRSRAVKRPKSMLLDTGLSCALTKFSPANAGLVGGREYYGKLVEQFVALELIKQRAFSATDFELYHYRNHEGLEVDLVAELADGRLVAIEVKSGRTVTQKSWAGLERFRLLNPDRQVIGVVLHGASDVAHMHGWLHVLPVTALWSQPPVAGW